jgi:hypothetical protein
MRQIGCLEDLPGQRYAPVGPPRRAPMPSLGRVGLSRRLWARGRASGSSAWEEREGWEAEGHWGARMGQVPRGVLLPRAVPHGALVPEALR